jgi:hypothetical protein
MEVNGQLRDPAALLPERETRYTLDWRRGGLWILSGRCGEEKYSCLCWE